MCELWLFTDVFTITIFRWCVTNQNTQEVKMNAFHQDWLNSLYFNLLCVLICFLWTLAVISVVDSFYIIHSIDSVGPSIAEDSDWSTYLNCILSVYLCFCVITLVHKHFRVCVYRNCSQAINYCIIIKHDYYVIKICLIPP